MWLPATSCLSDNFWLLFRIAVRLFRDDWDLGEVMRRRGRRRLPFQPRRSPWIGPYLLAVSERPGQVNERDQVADRQDRRPGRRHHVKHVQLRPEAVIVVAPRHAQVTQDE